MADYMTQLHHWLRLHEIKQISVASVRSCCQDILLNGRRWTAKETIETESLSSVWYSLQITCYGIQTFDTLVSNLKLVVEINFKTLVSWTLTPLVVHSHPVHAGLSYRNMAINFRKSSCIRIGPHNDATCASIVSLDDHVIHWMTEVR